MRVEGIARLGKRTKDLVKRLGPDDIAIIDHVDMDRVSAEAIIATGVEVVVNAAPSISGAYPNLGPLLLARAGVTLLDSAGSGVFDCLKDGDAIEVVGDEVLKDGTVCATGSRLTVRDIEEKMEAAKAGLGEQFDMFTRNTLEYIEREKGIISDDMWVPPTKTQIFGRQALVVVRGYDYKEDLATLRAYIREMKPVLIAVDGGADALLEAGFTPDIIIGDMDSATDKALRCGAELITDGKPPAMARLHSLGLEGIGWPLAATSEDIALLLAWESGADLIVAVGTHTNLVEYLDKGRKGMSSTFLIRLKVGPKLVDAKGVSRLFRASAGPNDLIMIVGAALVVVSALVLISPTIRSFLELIILRVRVWFGA